MKKLPLPGIFVFILFAGFLFASNTFAQTSADCLKQYHDSQAKCSDAAKSCIDGCPGAQGVDLGPLRECLRSCDSQKDSCIESAEAAYDVCISGTQQQKQQEQQTPAPSPQNSFPYTFIEVPIVENFEPTFVGLIGFDTAVYRPGDEELSEFDKELLEKALKRQSAITPQDEQEAWASIQYLEPKTEAEKQGQVAITKGQAQVKYATIDGGFIEVIRDETSQPIFVTYLDKIYAGATSDMTQINYHSWINDSGAVINMSQGTEIKFPKSLQDKTAQAINRALRLNKGEIEVKVRNNDPTVNRFVVDANGFFDLVVVQTHFFASYDPGIKQGAVIVYEGEVEVKTKDGKTIKVTPDGDKPGVIIVSQKLSVTRLVLASLVLAAVIGGSILVLRKKFTSKGASKKKK